MAVRESHLTQIATMFPNKVSIVRRGGRWRARLRFPRGLIVSVLVARTVRSSQDAVRWLVAPVQNERRFVTLLVRLDATNSMIFDLHVFPSIDRRERFYISLKDPWLNGGYQIRERSRICELVDKMRLAERK
jgi:hypothetical protein